MNQQSNSPTPKSGCLGCLFKLFIAFVFLVVAAIGGAYFIAMHTAMPFRMIASMAENADPTSGLRIEGISGSISSGFAIESMHWTGGEIDDVRVTYSGLKDLLDKKLIFREIHVGKAHLDVTNWTSSGKEAEPTPSANKANNWSLKLFQVDKLTFEDVVLTNQRTGFNLSIPSFEWTGFKVEDGKVEFGEINADSDRLKIVTKDAGSPEFQKLVEVTLLPKLSSVIRQPIDINTNVGWSANADGTYNVTSSGSAFGGKLDFEYKPDHSFIAHCKGLNLSDYFAMPLPQNLTLDAVADGADKKTGPMKLGEGSFTLGVVPFEIPSQVVDEKAVPFATGKQGDEEIRYELVQDGSNVRQQLTANPPLSPQDTVANVFYGKAYSGLQDSERGDVDKNLPIFSGSQTEPPAPTTVK